MFAKERNRGRCTGCRTLTRREWFGEASNGFGMLAQVPVLAISYDPKVDHVMDRTGMNQFSVPIGSLDAEDLAGRVGTMLATSEQIRSQLAERTQPLRELAEENARIALAVLRNDPKPPPLSADALALITRGEQSDR